MCTVRGHPAVRRAVIGLGNTGQQYTRTRHNIGFEVLDSFAAECQMQSWQPAPGVAASLTSGMLFYDSPDVWDAMASERSRRKMAEDGIPYERVAVWLSKPVTMMNRSGSACRKLAENPPMLFGKAAAGGALRLKGNPRALNRGDEILSLIHISEPTRLLSISYAVFCLKKKK
eukprot:TRINITY_DN62410_c0_g1_i1.p1 TRINITY_DN62410_c0_g1~~TRINITY_DN62410_c0_g1_i1.p1  ORF type:complete len:173 (+),score=34.07 TRINITY_DN62410_c0_g1_i1:2-520(+)